MKYDSLEKMVKVCEKKQIPFWKLVCQENAKELDVSETECFEKMKQLFQTMKCADAQYNEKLTSASGMAGGDGAKLEKFRKEGKSIFGDFLAEVIEKAVKMGESNACMKRIVAAPTAGSCGVVSAVLLTYEDQKKMAEDKMTEALFIAGGIGEIIANNASIAGAEGGCQAEIGSASAMAAGAVAYLEGGDNECIVNAAALALKNMLGLTCDPVAGLVEVPCVKRNASGAVNAMLGAQMALAGIRSMIPPDEVIDAMQRIGKMMPECLRETSEGGLATTKTGLRIKKKLVSEDKRSEKKKI